MKSWQSFRKLFKDFSGNEWTRQDNPPPTAPAADNSEKGASKRIQMSINPTENSYDPLTGLPSTQLFLQQTRQLISSAARQGLLTGVIEIGLQDIKRVNETFGPRFAEVLIRQSAFRLYSIVQQNHHLARVGTVNFSVALAPFPAIEDALNVAQRLVDTLGETFSMIELAEHRVQLSARAGLSVYPTHANNSEDLLYQASLALSQAGSTGAGRVQVFSPQRREESKLGLELEWRMHEAIRNGEFSLSYQPEVDLNTHKVIRREALLRWKTGSGEVLQPAAFIPVAEKTGLILPLGNWVLREACHQAYEWQQTGEPEIGVGVNVSALQLNEERFADSVAGALAESRLEGRSLELELTESALVENPERSLRQLGKLREMGVNVVIDDFGVGYSSLIYLKELPVHGLKLDRSFLRDLQQNANTLPIIRSIVSLAHSLNMRVTVEGVETVEELNEVQKLHVDIAQGYFLGRPEVQASSRRSAAASKGST